VRHLLLLDTLFGGSLLLGCRLLSFLHWRLLGSLLGGLLGCTLLGSWSLLGRALLGCLLSSRLILCSGLLSAGSLLLWCSLLLRGSLLCFRIGIRFRRCQGTILAFESVTS